MTLSYTATGVGALARSELAVRRRVLVTGAAGRIGSYFAEHSHERYDIRLMVRRAEQVAALEPFGDVVLGGLDDLDSLKARCEGIDTVVHMAADPDPSATWSSLLEANIVGTYNVYVAAKAMGCRRVVFASSIHAVSGYPADVQVKTSEPVNPGDLYGVSKCFGEAMGRYMAEQEGLSVIAIRIGAFQSHESMRENSNVAMFDAWVSPRDLNQLIQRCIDVETLRFAILHGVSNNRFKRLDISDARVLVGYEPEDDLTKENPALATLSQPEHVRSHNLGDGQTSGLRDDL